MCGPGKYYGKNKMYRNVACQEYYGQWGCVQCPGNKVKSVSGNKQSLCVECNRTSMPGSDQASCSKYIGCILEGDRMMIILTDRDADLNIW